MGDEDLERERERVGETGFPTLGAALRSFPVLAVGLLASLKYA